MSDRGYGNEGSDEAQHRKGIYLYCVARPGPLRDIHAKGIDDHNPIFLAPLSLDIAGVVSMTSLEEFCGPLAEARMCDLSWVGPRACRHEELVEYVMRRSPVLPVRFGTIFSSLERLDAVLEKHHDAVSRFLDWVSDKEEWAVKGFLDRAKATELLVSRAFTAHGERLASSSPGMQYLQERRTRAAAEKELGAWLKNVCDEVASDLSHYASDSCQRKVLRAETEGTEMILNHAFLVPRDAVRVFRSRADRAKADYAEQGLIFELSGPWPPYSFCPSVEKDRET